MNLKYIFNQFSKEESKKFILFLQKQNRRGDVKNIKLFKLLQSSSHDKKVLPTLIYGSDNKNAYHALRKRLYDSLIDFKASNLLQKDISEDLEITKWILASRDFFKQNHIEIGVKTLLKAEKKALLANHYTLLNEIYHTLIEFHFEEEEELSKLIKKSSSNLEKLKQEELLNNAYAVIKNFYSNKIGEEKPFEILIKEVFQRFKINETEGYSYKSVYQLIQLANTAAIATKDYFSIESFVIKAYQRLVGLEDEQEKDLYYKTYILYIIANLYFRKKEFKKSLVYVREMEISFLKSEQKYKIFFKPLHDCLHSLNQNYLGNYPEATKVLKPYLSHFKKYDIAAILDIYLCLVVYEFQQGNIKEAKTYLARFYHTDAWYTNKIGVEWVIKKNLIEILIYIELDDYNFASSRIISFERKYKAFLLSNNKNRVVQFLGFVKSYYLKEEKVSTEIFKQKLKNDFSWKIPLKEDVFEMSFFAWLKSKMDNKPIYEVTLELVKMK